jgi:hypothetical protein
LIELTLTTPVENPIVPKNSFNNMIIKNISGEARYFGFGTKARGRTIANNGTSTIPDEQTVLAAAQHYVDQGLLQIVSGPSAAAIVGGGTTPASGFLLVTGTVADNDTVEIAGEVFKFANAPTGPVLGKYYASLSARWAGDGAGAGTAAGTLVTAINAVTTLNVAADAATLYDTGKYIIPLKAKNNTTVQTGLTLVATSDHIAASGATLSAGANQAGRRTILNRHTVTADEETAGVILIHTGLPDITFYVVQLRDATGLSKAWTGLVKNARGALLLCNAGLVAFAETDVFNVIACE